jgi:hypothetical protein
MSMKKGEFELFRQATADEMELYFNGLYPLQDEVLQTIKNEAFYLTGGTALSRFHYQHRFSDFTVKLTKELLRESKNR